MIPIWARVFFGFLPPPGALHWALVLPIVASLLVVAVESVPALVGRYGTLFSVIELVATGIFAFEYGGRIWAAGQGARSGTGRARIRYLVSPWGIIDLLAVLPLWLAWLTPIAPQTIFALRTLRFLKLARYSPAIRSLLDVLYAERRALFGCLIIMLGATFFSATLMHAAERIAQPEKFGTVPDAMWWAIVTLGTIGYGDVVPVTLLGRFIATATIFAGLIMVALPVGIIATAFADEIHRRDFIITWGMVARVPLFSELTALNIAEIMRLLKARRASPDEIIVRRGDVAHSMYFISTGEVEVKLKHKRVTLGPGQFFGEVAALRNARRSATAVAMVRTNLLILDASDLRALMEREPAIATHINRVVKTRIGAEILTPRGDLVAEELSEPAART